MERSSAQLLAGCDLAHVMEQFRIVARKSIHFAREGYRQEQ
jgi:hypothetical protein